MSLLELLHFFSFLIYLYLIIFVLYLNPKGLINRVCALLIFCFAIWSFATIFISDISFSKDTARLAMNIGSLGWCSWPVFTLWFFFVMTEKQKILKKYITYLWMFLPAVLFIYLQWKGLLIDDYIRQPYGWSYTWSKSIWPPLFYIYYFLFVTAGLSIYFDFRRKSKETGRVLMSKISFVTTPLSMILGSINNVLLQELNIHRFPPLADVLSFVWIIGLVYVIKKYGFMTITPAAAAEDTLATMADSLILINPDKKIIRVNKATLDLLGFKEEELIGKPIDNILNGHSLFKGEQFERLIKEGQTKDYDMEYKSKSRETIPVSFSASVMYDKHKQMLGIVGVAKDLRQIEQLIRALQQERSHLDIKVKQRTLELEKANIELKAKTEELISTQVQLIQSAKMAAVGQLGAGVAHELNNPLGGILGYAQFILEKIKRPEFSSEDFKSCIKYIESIERESTRCKGIVESLLKFSRRPISPQPELIDVALAINETLAIIGHQLKLKNITLTTDIPEGLDKVFGITNQLQQVFTNLILNAQQAMPEAGQLKIAARNILGENKVEIEFTDTGCGISEENLKHIFEPFFTTKQKEKGTGLGLAVSYQIIQDHKGTIEIKSEVGKGTTIVIRLPVEIKE